MVTIIMYNMITTGTSCGCPPTVTSGSYEMPINTVVGTSMTYSCDIGFTLSGSATITCLNSGNWSTLPSCTGIMNTCMHEYKVDQSLVPILLLCFACDLLLQKVFLLANISVGVMFVV